MVYSVIWTNPFDHLSCQLEAQVLEPKRYAILLEFLGDLCLKVGFCLSVIPFSSAINVISTRNAALI